jgi:hypothetical protein
MPPLRLLFVLALGCGALALTTTGTAPTTAPSSDAPDLRFSTYLGGSAMDVGSAIAVDADGYVYVAGQTLSDDFPTLNPAQDRQGGPLFGADAFVAKLSPNGDSLVWATYLGGSMGEELVSDLVVDGQGRVYVAGSTTAPDFPRQNPLRGYQGGDQLGTDGFVVRLSTDGTTLDFATYLGGAGDDAVTALALGPDGDVVVAGTTTSDDFPATLGVVQPERAGQEGATARTDAFIARLDADDARLVYATYLGGTGQEIPSGLAVDATGRAWVTGLTTSFDFPTQNALQTTFAGPIRAMEGDAFVARLSADGTALDVATYLGGSQDDQPTGLALDADGRVVITGWTESPDFPTTPGAYQTTRQGLRDRFVVRLASVGDTWILDASTRLGAAGGFALGRAGLAVDRAGRVYVAGAAGEDDVPIVNPVQFGYGGGEADAFLARLDADGATLGIATFLGGTEADVITATVLGPDALCVTGSTGSPDFPTQQPLQAAFDGPRTTGQDVTSAIVACYAVENAAPVLTRIAVTPETVDLVARDTVVFAAEGIDQFDQPLAADVTWSTTGGVIDTAGTYVAADAVGTYTITATHPATGVTGTATVDVVSGVDAEDAADVPDAFALYPNYPNPFNPETTIRFDVKATARVVLTLYDALGRKQATLVERDYAPGRHAVRFDARGWPSGVYFYEIEMQPSGAGDAFRTVRQMVLLR